MRLTEMTDIHLEVSSPLIQTPSQPQVASEGDDVILLPTPTDNTAAG